jgi:hypothetical protein
MAVTEIACEWSTSCRVRGAGLGNAEAAAGGGRGRAYRGSGRCPRSRWRVRCKGAPEPPVDPIETRPAAAAADSDAGPRDKPTVDIDQRGGASEFRAHWQWEWRILPNLRHWLNVGIRVIPCLVIGRLRVHLRRPFTWGLPGKSISSSKSISLAPADIMMKGKILLRA